MWQRVKIAFFSCCQFSLALSLRTTFTLPMYWMFLYVEKKENTIVVGILNYKTKK